MQEKVDFELSFPEYGDFGQVIKTVAKVETAIGDETTIIAKTNGTINFAVDNLTSTSTTAKLAANQGRILDEKKADKNSLASKHCFFHVE